MDAGDDVLSRRFDIFIMTLILLNVAAVILETVKGFYLPYKQVFLVFEYFSVAVFSVEYLLRLWTITENEKYCHPVLGRAKWVVSFIAIIDLLAILPFYLPLFLAIDGRFLRILRLFRIVRIFKMGRYSKAFNMISKVVGERKEELLVTLTIVIVMLILASSLMYYVENEAQPEAFESIPSTMWWGVATLTTVGYGDVYPITPLGRMLGAFIAILGVGIFALPAGIVAGGFESEINKKLREKLNQRLKEEQERKINEKL